MMKNILWTVFYICLLPALNHGGNVGDSCQVARSGAQGICKVITECQEVITDIVKKGLYPTQCGFLGRDQIVCCPAPIRVTTEIIPIARRISQKSVCPF